MGQARRKRCIEIVLGILYDPKATDPALAPALRFLSDLGRILRKNGALYNKFLDVLKLDIDKTSVVKKNNFLYNFYNVLSSLHLAIDIELNLIHPALATISLLELPSAWSKWHYRNIARYALLKQLQGRLKDKRGNELRKDMDQIDPLIDH